MTNFTQKGSVKVVILVIAALVAAGILTLALQTRKSSPLVGDYYNPGQGSQALKTYQIPNSNLEIQYPNIFKLAEVGGGIFMITHSINNEHPDPCNFKDASTLNVLTDFSLRGELRNQSVNDAIYDADLSGVKFDKVGNPIIDGQSDLSPVTFGSLSGYKTSEGVEGCGFDEYFIKVSDKETMIFTHAYVAEFSAVNGDAEKYRSLPGVISTDKSGEYLKIILSSLKLVAPPNTTVNMSDWKTYTNTKNGYTVKYPSDWVAKENTDNSVTLTYDNEIIRGPHMDFTTEGSVVIQIVQAACEEQTWRKDRSGFLIGRSCISHGNVRAQITFNASSEYNQTLEGKILSTFKFIN